MYKKYIKE